MRCCGIKAWPEVHVGGPTRGIGRIAREAVRAAALSASLLAAPAWALYKVIGPDGRVTYTDRLQPAPGTSTLPLREAADAGGALPPALRRVAQRFPVTLYVAAGCASSCDAARQALIQRGIPYAERTVASRADIETLERLSGGREAPTLTVGSQVMRGFSESLWQQVLDAAGYPAVSQLPRDYQRPLPRPVTEQTEIAVPSGASSVAPPMRRPAERPATPRTGTEGIRF